MRCIKPLLAVVLSITLFGCQNQTKEKAINANKNVQTQDTKADSDLRPKDQIYFLNKVRAESDYSITSNSIKKDAHIEDFNKYAKDTLKEFKNWEFIVDEVNDNRSDANTISQIFGWDENPIYNLKVVSPIKVDNSVDTIAIDNRVNFTYTIPKLPKGAPLKKQLTLIKDLNKGDTIIVSGAVTHFNNKGKIDFATFYDQDLPWNIDLMVSDIWKKGKHQ
ncbi:hypothetical protein GWR56_11195 [Mucilaginibacter sp. 14171R-50]|uniref:hypothetical protein n=1 Tax=Mucilaginibacter sp. 14171R-50 TaxID=2703789 RepID=UPI00138D911B|nr:hypothetical protein [Mucilaginibacter sp. 14171R-50]QHS56071.1 hypothetical protein GWR56_11195 [Mucilaginibacter sp. 14171R-50]